MVMNLCNPKGGRIHIKLLCRASVNTLSTRRKAQGHFRSGFQTSLAELDRHVGIQVDLGAFIFSFEMFSHILPKIASIYTRKT